MGRKQGWWWGKAGSQKAVGWPLMAEGGEESCTKVLGCTCCGIISERVVTYQLYPEQTTQSLMGLPLALEVKGF